MTQDVLPAQLDTELWEEEIWDELLTYIEDPERQRVIPIVGPDLLQVEVEGAKVLLDRYIADRLALHFALPADALLGEPTLNNVVCQLLLQGKNRSFLNRVITDILLKAAFPPPRPLLQLAEITHFNLFVTTTFDSLLEEAINSVRFGGKPETVVLVYATNDNTDLPSAREYLSRPTVYHLLGRVAATAPYVITDEDMLEFVCALQSESHCPEKLFDELENNHLLILGEEFPDWVARFFLRAAKRHRLSEPRSVLEILADTRTRRDMNLMLFLHHFSSRTRIFQPGGAIEFVEELWRRWKERNPEAAARLSRPQVLPAPEMPEGAIFISYAHEDLAAVQEIKASLDAAGLTVWFDFARLEAGDDWDRKIRTNIRNCSCFLPVLSQHTEARREGYFRREWNYALDRDMNINSTYPFLIPVVVDDIKEFHAVPERFLQRHLTHLPQGHVSPEFVKRMQAIVAQR